MSEKYPFIPDHLTKALEDISIPLIDIMHGELKNLMLIAEQNWEAAKNGDPLDDDEYDESDSFHQGYLQALTEMYCLTYNLSIDRKNIEEKYYA